MILILNGLLCLSSFDLGIEVVPFMQSVMKWNMKNWNWWFCSSSLPIIWAVHDSTRMSSEVQLLDFSSEEETSKGDDEPEKKKRRKRERIAKMFERDGKATNLAEGWDFPNLQKKLLTLRVSSSRLPVAGYVVSAIHAVKGNQEHARRAAGRWTNNCSSRK